jgi:hypothetical protein
MTPIVFPAVCAAGAALAWLTRPYPRLGPLVGLACLASALAAALLLGASSSATIGDVRLDGSTYAARFLAVATAAGLILCVVGLVANRSDRLIPAALAAFAGLGVALTATDPTVAMVAAVVAAATGALVTVPDESPAGEPDNRVSEARTLALMVGSLLFAAVAVSRPSWAAQDGPVLVLGFTSLAAALAVRSGSIPFHLPAARLGRHHGSMAPALLLVWIPAGFGLLAVSWSATTFGVANDWLAVAVAAVQVGAVATLLLGAVGAILHRDVTEVAVYSIVADSGFVLLALASRDAGAASPVRLWLLVFVAAKTAFVAWSAAATNAFGTSDLGELHGWLRRTPLLGLALVGIAMATIGWPGSPVYEARSTLIDLGLPGRLHLIGAAAIVLALAYYGRVLLVGLMTPGETVKAARGERPRLAPGAIGADVAEPSTETAVADSVVAEPELPAPRPKPRRRTSRAAAAAEPRPTTTGAVELAAPAVSIDEATSAEPAPEPTVANPAGPGLPTRLHSAWDANRTLEVSGAALAAAALALALASGGLGASGASGGGIPFETAAHATATPTPRPTVSRPQTPVSTLAPLASHNPRPSESANPSAVPSPSAAPTRSTLPAPIPKA